MTTGSQSETPAAGTPDLGPFERLQAELEAAVAKLGEEDLPLEERLALHAKAVGLHARLEELLGEARERAAAVEQAEGSEGAGGATGGRADEPYEVLHTRLQAVVERLEDSDLALSEVVRLHGEAHRLAARCDHLLKTAQGRVDRLTSRPGDSGSRDSAPPPDPPEDDEEAPF